MSLVVYGSKTSTLATLGALDQTMILAGFTVGACLAAGGFWGKRIILRIAENIVSRFLYGILLVSGSAIILQAA